jgi:hypothetical protein
MMRDRGGKLKAGEPGVPVTCSALAVTMAGGPSGDHSAFTMNPPSTNNSALVM